MQSPFDSARSHTFCVVFRIIFIHVLAKYANHSDLYNSTKMPKAMPFLKKPLLMGLYEECADKCNGLFLIFSIFLLFLLAGFSHHYPQTSKWWHFQLLTQSTLQHIWRGTWENRRLSGLMLLTPPYKVCFCLELERKIVLVVVSTITMASLCFHKIF